MLGVRVYIYIYMYISVKPLNITRTVLRELLLLLLLLLYYNIYTLKYWLRLPSYPRGQPTCISL